MDKINLFNEAEKSGGKIGHRPPIFKAADFDVDLQTFDPERISNLHTCSKEEFFYVVKGEVEMQVENLSLHMREGDAIMVKPGEKHKHKIMQAGALMMVTKRPHEHRSYD